MAENAKTGLLDLEKELTCSICTEVLYQPLTLLDCLHTFCGSCLKEWFAFQGSHNSNSSTQPYSCPSCRSGVRETRPDAKVTTLLDMYLQANPEKGKTAGEKEERGAKYTPGENVAPRLERKADSGDDEDRRMVEEIREMSLREVGVRGPRSYERGTRHRNRSPDSRDEGVRQRRRRDAQHTGLSPRDSRAQARQLGHQSSLRSLLSTDAQAADIEEEILRQIMDEGLLDGIDLNNLDTLQEDELSEHIAEAYRRRHHSQSSASRSSRQENPRVSRGNATRPVEPQSTHAARRQHARSTSTVEQTTHSLHPPVSRPHLLDAHPTHSSHRRRTSSESRRQTSPVPVIPQTRHEAARSTGELSGRPHSSESRVPRPLDMSSQGRRATDPRPHRPSEEIGLRQDTDGQPPSRSGDMTGSSPSRSVPMQNVSDISSSSRYNVSDISSSSRYNASDISSLSRQSVSDISSSSRQNVSDISSAPRHNVSDISSVSRQRESTRAIVIDSSPNVSPRISTRPFEASSSAMSRPASSSSAASRLHPPLYVEPLVTCDRCGKRDIEYELHEHCSTCNDGNYNLCHRCYRLGRGCLHWFGFGQSAWHHFQNQASSTTSLPHTLTGHRYQKPRKESLQPNTEGDRKRVSTEDPSTRLQAGAFCSNCAAFANDCFWKCDYCNDGEWGFCNRCVNQGKCCTHALLPVAHVSTVNPQETNTSGTAATEASFAPIISPRMVQSFPPFDPTSSGQYRPLTFSTNCKICGYPVQPSQTRFHCYQCNDGDYEIHTTCYSKLAASGRISRDNGERGWRRCLEGHRMIVAGFEDATVGQRRLIVRDLVGGHALKDEAGATASINGEWSWREGHERQKRTVSRQVPRGLEGNSAAPAPLFQKFPPDGGVGMIVLALWTYLPQEGATDELSFPKGAEIREAEDINGDWFWGCYAGAKALFPAPYVKVLAVATM
ncbi:hypothetical protein MMC26_002848 [Xylographa opegraphella]|nr:hypothetical protein [Xylographa opegraphella]